MFSAVSFISVFKRLWGAKIGALPPSPTGFPPRGDRPRGVGAYGVEHLAGTSQLVLPMPPKIKCRTFALPRASASRTPVPIPRKLQSRPSASNLIVTVTLNPNP